MIVPEDQRDAEYEAQSLDSTSDRDLIPCDNEDARFAKNYERGLPGWYVRGTLKKFAQRDQFPVADGTAQRGQFPVADGRTEVRDDEPIDAPNREEDDERRAHDFFLLCMDARRVPFEAPLPLLGFPKECN